MRTPETPRRPLAFLAASLAAATLVLTGCFNGTTAMTTVQSEDLTGNGVQAQVGSIRAENLTLVLGPEGSSSATLITRIVNGNQEEADRLIGVQIDGIPAFVTGDEVELPPRSSIGFGFDSDLWINSYDFRAASSTYVPVALQFERSGIARVDVLVVPPLGYYEGIEPVPPAA